MTGGEHSCGYGVDGKPYVTTTGVVDGGTVYTISSSGYETTPSSDVIICTRVFPQTFPAKKEDHKPFWKKFDKRKGRFK